MAEPLKISTHIPSLSSDAYEAECLFYDEITLQLYTEELSLLLDAALIQAQFYENRRFA